MSSELNFTLRHSNGYVTYITLDPDWSPVEGDYLRWDGTWFKVGPSMYSVIGPAAESSTHRVGAIDFICEECDEPS